MSGAAIAIFADRRDRRIKSPISGRIKSPISGMLVIGDQIRRHSLSLPVPTIFSPFHCDSTVKFNQSSWAILSHDFSKWRKGSKIVSKPKKKKSIRSTAVRKSYAYLM